MVGYPGSDGERRIAVVDLQELVGRIFAACGMGDADATLVADHLVQADLSGIHSHGVLRVPEYAARLTAGSVDPRARPRIVTDSRAAVVVDGGNAMGHVACSFAMRTAIDRARTQNVGIAAVRGSNHSGAMAYYAKMAAAEDMIGLATTNALPTMAPWGGLDKILGINPLGVAMPTETGPPLVYDAAFSASSIGKIRVFGQKGLAIPEGWAFDPAGRPTTDPEAAIAGLLQPIGDYKGVGLALVMGVLSTLLSGAAYGTELGSLAEGAKPGQDGHFLMAIRIAAFVDPAEFKRRLDGVLEQIRSSRRAEGVERLYAPGEPEAETEAAFGGDGIPLNAATLAGLAATARQLGVDPAPAG